MADQNFRVKNGLEVGIGGTVITTLSSGNVGVGTTNPTSKLWVNGDAYFVGVVTSSGFYVGGSLIGSGSVTVGPIVGTALSISGISTSSEFVGGGSDLRNLSGTHLVSYASASDISNSALSIAGINTYTQVGILTGSFATNTNDFFGYSVATSADGKTVIVGAYRDEIGATTDTGVVYVFDRVGNSFNQVGILTGSFAGDISDKFGQSVEISADGKTIIVGAADDEKLLPNPFSVGLVYVFDRVGVGSTSTFNQVGILNGSLEQSNDQFGYSLATSADGKTIVVGATQDGGSGIGLVYVFDRIGNSFNQVGILTGSYAVNADDNFGYSLATSADGKTIVVGAYGDEVGATADTGVVYVFDRVGNSFNQVGILTGSLAVDSADGFGSAVEISADGKTIVVGARSDEVGATSDTGVVYVFDRVGNSFNQVGILTGSLAVDANDNFGNSVATSADGKTIVVGAYGDEIGATTGTGVVYVFNRQGNNFNQVGIITGTYSTNSNDFFGRFLTISADAKSIIVGVPNDEIGATTSTGIAYVYDQVRETYVYSGPTGNIGIGTTNPTSKLTVQGDVLVSGVVTATTYYGSGANLTGISGGVAISTNTTNQAQYLTYVTGTGTTTGLGVTTTGLVFNPSSGNLGIGTTNPQAKLDVSADAKISGLTIGKGTGSVSSNTALGYQALLSNTTGAYNTATGFQALFLNTTGYRNTANGYGALRFNTTGYYNTATGNQALYSNTTGTNNTATGFQALLFNTTGFQNTANGYYALYSNTTGVNNTAFGTLALRSNTTGSYNTATGVQALFSNTTGSINTANGYNALRSNTTGYYNTATGRDALFSNTTGSNNTANGNQALYSNTTGFVNTANGYRALFSNTTGAYNTATGSRVLNSNTTGSNNTANGYLALNSNTTGTNNSANGYRALRSNTTGTNNSATGSTALLSNTTGTQNTATGSTALSANTTGYRNTANGYGALYSNTTGFVNTATGYQALFSNTTGFNNTANGYYTLRSNTTGYSNTANGYAALSANTTGTTNTANGYQALYSNTTGTTNTATGFGALYLNTTGSQNTATGVQALRSNTTGTTNTANGYSALRFNTTGTSNTAIGGGSLRSNTTGTNNTANGYAALYSNTTGTQNTATGYQALLSNTTGYFNTAIGYQAGNTITTGTNNSFLGYNAQASSVSVSNEITLGDTNVNTLRVPGLGFYAVRTNTTVATTSATTIDSIVVATYRSARIQIQITQGSNYQVSDVLLIHDGTTASIIEYGTLATGSTLGTYSATISSGNALLQVTMGSATSSAVKVLSYRTVV